MLYVSHDRYFINQTATRILELTGQTLVNYIGNYDYYLEKKEELTRIYAPAADAAAPEETAAPSEASSTKLDWKAQKEEQARLRKRQNDLKKTEERIGVLETRNGKIDELMMQEEVYTNSVKCQELAKEKAANEAELEELYEKWEELNKPVLPIFLSEIRPSCIPCSFYNLSAIALINPSLFSTCTSGRVVIIARSFVI